MSIACSEHTMQTENSNLYLNDFVKNMNTPYHKIFPNYSDLTVQHNKAKCKIKEEKKQLRPSQKQCKLKDAVAENAQEEHESAEAAHPVTATEPQSHPAELLNHYKYP